MRRIWIYHAASFLSAFLLFAVQPMTSKALLPVFGGSYLVWGACMVFYQFIVLMGYLYAHVIQRLFGVRLYSRMHPFVMLLGLLLLSPAALDASPLAGGSLPLSIGVFLDLLRLVGFPVFVLSTTSILLQRWLSVSDLGEKANPYVLYSASNAGSMLGLLCYPVLVEPFMDLPSQNLALWGGYAGLVLVQAFCLPSGKVRGERAVQASLAPVAKGAIVAWFLLAMAPCAAFLAVTNVVTFDLAAIPMLWIGPLAVYLLSFVLAFRREPWRPRFLRPLLGWAVAVGLAIYLMLSFHITVPAWGLLSVYLLVLLVICLNCADRLVEMKPAGDRLTQFYLVLALGGLVGGVVVSWVMPVVSRTLVEWPLALVLALLAAWWADRVSGAAAGSGAPDPGHVLPLTRMGLASSLVVLALVVIPWVAGARDSMDDRQATLTWVCAMLPLMAGLRMVSRRLGAMALVVLVAGAASLLTEDFVFGTSKVRTVRNYYGILRVFDKGSLRYLQHGTTLHGRQYREGPMAEMPLSYYHSTTPAAGVMTCQAFRFDRIGMVGLGTGALAAYAGEGQSITVFELDPDAILIAEKDFTYLAAARRHGAEVRMVPGDGRLSVAREPRSSLNLLIVDAFSSGSIPIHLLTTDALRVYLDVLKPNGILLIHVSNRLLDLPPILYSNARVLGVSACENENAEQGDADESHWMALSRDPERVEMLKGRLGWFEREMRRLPAPWTDRYSNLITALLQ